jgi:predicted P-loop ATPase
VRDAAVTVTRRNICTAFRLYPKVEETREAITCACQDNKSDPVLDYFKNLKWDGTPRLDKLFHKYLGADDTVLNGVFSRKVMCAIVRRARCPGCKYDQQLILHGPQGIRKSTFCEDLAVFPDLFTDTGDLSGSIKDQMDIIQGMQIIEFPELAGYSRASREHNKAMVSRKVDRSRLSYGHYATNAPRRSIAIATTNEDAYLTDPTGERRYWNVAMTQYDRDSFLADKDQLYAEAVAIELSENLWLDTPELVAEHDAIVATVKEPNELVDLLANLYGEAWHVNGEDEERISTADIRDMLNMTPTDAVRAHNIGRRIADAMKTLGWTKARATLRCHKGHPPTTGYTRPLPFGPRNAPRIPVS